MSTWCRVAVVSAHAVARDALERVLREEGCEVAAYPPGDAALRGLKKDLPEVVFAGPMDPEMIDFLARVESTLGDRKPHVAIVLEAPATDADVHPEELRAFVRGWIAGPREDRTSATAFHFGGNGTVT